MTEAEREQYRSVLVSSLRKSKTNPRKTIDKARMADLIQSVQLRGVIQPLLVRVHPTEADAFEIIAGERRFKAATAAKLEHVPVLVKDLDDKGVLEVQVIENLQREEIHQLEESEGYDALIKKHGYTLADLAARIGKSTDYVTHRLKLVDLVDKRARTAFLEGELSAGVAFALARVPDAKLQGEAFLAVANRTPGEAVRVIRDQYMLPLAKAPFDKEATDLVDGVGACGPCPSRTGNQANLFGDVNSKDVCTNPTCFAAKRAASAAIRIRTAKETGVKVLEGEAAKKAMPYGDHHLNGFVILDKPNYEDPKSRTNRQILGKAAPEPVLIVDPNDKAKVYEVIPVTAFKEAAKEVGFAPAKAAAGRSASELKKEQQAKERKRMQRAVVNRSIESIADLITRRRTAVPIALRAVIANSRTSRDLLEHHGLLPAKKTWQHEFDGVVLKAIAQMDEAKLVGLLAEAALTEACQYLGGETYPRLLTNLAGEFGIDLRKLEKEYAGDQLKKAELKKAGKAVDAATATLAPKKAPAGAPNTAMAAALANATPAKSKKKPAAKAKAKK